MRDEDLAHAKGPDFGRTAPSNKRRQRESVRVSGLTEAIQGVLSLSNGTFVPPLDRAEGARWRIAGSKEEARSGRRERSGFG